MEDRQEHRAATVHAGADILALGAEFDPRDILEPGDAAFGAGLNDDVLKLFDLAQSTQGTERDLVFLPAAHRFLADGACRDLSVLLANRVHYFGRGHPPGSQPARVQPDAHAVILLTEQEHVADAGNPRQFIFDLHQGEIAQVELVVAAVGRVDRQAAQDVGRAFAGRDAGLTNDFRQLRNGQVDAVLHQHLGHVDIDAVMERDGQIVAAVVGALRRHVHHGFDAVDLLFDGRRHRIGDLVGVGAGIVARDLHGRRRDLWELRQGQGEERDSSRQRNHDGQHCGKDRPIDEEA